MKTKAYKVFTHDLRSPVQGGEPVWDGNVPYNLPTTEVDTSDKECGAGWNACLSASNALRIAGLWPDGFPSRLFEIETDSEVFERGNKVRSSSWTILKEIKDIKEFLLEMNEPFGDLKEELTQEILNWREAFSRPLKDKESVIQGLEKALELRGLSDWELKEFPDRVSLWTDRDAWVALDARAAGDAWDAWDAALYANAAWYAWYARAARDAWRSWAAWAARDAWDARAAMDARNAWAARNASAARDAMNARNALIVWVVSKKGWIEQDPSLLTTGLRDAYQNGLQYVIPVGEKTLGWTMEK